MKNFFKIFLVSILAFATLLTFAACGDEDQNKDSLLGDDTAVTTDSDNEGNENSGNKTGSFEIVDDTDNQWGPVHEVN